LPGKEKEILFLLEGRFSSVWKGGRKKINQKSQIPEKTGQGGGKKKKRGSCLLLNGSIKRWKGQGYRLNFKRDHERKERRDRRMLAAF